MGWFAKDSNGDLYMISNTQGAWFLPKEGGMWSEIKNWNTEKYRPKLQEVSIGHILEIPGVDDISILVQTGIDIRDYAERNGIYLD